MAIKRQQIMDRIALQLTTITVANGYYTNMGSHVYVWRPIPVLQDESVGVSLHDTSDEITEKFAGNQVNHLLTVEMDIISFGGTDDLIRQALADIYKLVSTDTTWNGLAITTEPVKDEMMIQYQDKRIAGSTLTINVVYRTQKWLES